jgi:hypothetical protein
VIDWRSVRDLTGDSGVAINGLLGGAGELPVAAAWEEIDSRLIVEEECWCSAGFAALPRLAELACCGVEEQQNRALDLAATIVRSLHRCHEHDHVVRSSSAALVVLHSMARARLASSGAGRTFVRQLQDAIAFAGYTFWAVIDIDFVDEHYHLGCPHCATRLVIVIGRYGRYSAIRDYLDGDVHRLPLLPAAPQDLTGIGRWMHEAAVAADQTEFADGLTYLFGRAGCGSCRSVFTVAEWLEADNSPTQPIDPIVPRTDRST